MSRYQAKEKKDYARCRMVGRKEKGEGLDQYIYEGLIERLEAEAENSPAAFRSKVFLISSIAYLVLFGTLLGAALLIYFGLNWAYDGHQTSYLIDFGLFALVMLPVFLAVLRMFFMRLEAPEGRPITREEAPQLFDVLDKMRKKLNGPPIHHVLIDRRFNAAISQLPRWGLFGGHTNYLTLGLPYMLGVPPQEMLATVAHEYGHLYGEHGKLSAWVYRQRRTFAALHAQVGNAAEDTWIHGVVAKALHRFMPYFNAYTFVLSRQNEYDADLTATRLIGAQINATGLIRDSLLGRWVHEEFWPKLLKQADSSARPAFMPFGAMRTAFKASYEQWATRERLAAAWREKSDVHDTHPALRNRVEATGQPSALPEPVDITAAEALLGPTAKQLIQEFDQCWWKEEKKSWESRYQYATRSKARLRELSLQALDALKLPDLQELAMLKVEFDSPQTAKPVLEHLLRRSGGPFPKASYLYGRILLGEGNDLGLDHLRSAANSDRILVEDAAHAGYYFLLNKHGEQAARSWWNNIMPGRSG